MHRLVKPIIGGIVREDVEPDEMKVPMSTRLTWLLTLSAAGLLLVLTLAALPASASPAGTTYYVDPGGSNAHSCIAPGAATACQTIGGALGKAAISGDAIVVAAGTYHEHLNVDKSVTVTGAGANSTILDGSATDRVMTVTFNNAVTLVGLTIKNGKTSGNGGGILNNGSLALENTVVATNTAGANGGGIYSNRSLSLTASSVLTNAAGNGGGIYNFGPLIGFGYATLDNSVVQGNTVITDGGGIYSTDSGSDLGFTKLSLQNNTSVRGNVAAFQGGGLYISGTLSSTGSQIDDNLTQKPAPNGLSGAGVLIASGKAALTSDTLNGNISTGAGGAVGNQGSLTMTNVTLISNVAGGAGGGLDNWPAASVVLTGGAVVSNTAGSDGGGLYNAGQLAGTNLDVRGNQAPFGGGGGLFNITGTMTLQDSQVSQNMAHYDGGGLFNADSGALAMTGGALQANFANSSGAGLFNQSLTAPVSFVNIQNNTTAGFGGGINNYLGRLTVGNSVLIGNSANDTLGGGGIVNQLGLVTVNNTTISENHADNGSGGGIEISHGTTLVTNSTISRNSGGSGAGINNFGESALGFGATLWLTNTTVSGNRASADGGGLWNNWSASLNNVTLAGNVADSLHTGAGQGGGIFMPVTVTAVLTPLNSIVANNIDLSGQAPDCRGFIASAGYNLVGNSQGCNFSPNGFTDLVGTANNPINPLLAPLALNGNPNGPLTDGLFVGSPAIDSGSPFPPGNATACAAKDERGVNRPVGARCDMGAFEGTVPFLQVFLPLARR